MEKIIFYRFKKFLQEIGIANIEIPNVFDAIKTLHYSVSNLDAAGRKSFFLTFPTTRLMLNRFGSLEDCLCFDNTGKTEKQIRKIDL